jgi:hypothetical protein
MLETLTQLFLEIKADMVGCSYSNIPEIVDTPKGKKESYDGNKEIFDHIFVDQHAGSCGDDYYGHVYYPIEGKYLKVEFYC